MLICAKCGKGKHIIAFSRHRKGHGISGQWRLRAPIHKRLQLPNLHVFKGQKYCTKCLRIVKQDFLSKINSQPKQVNVQTSASST